ncbi:MAG: DUF1853 family protein [Halioglobus sp.]
MMQYPYKNQQVRDLAWACFEAPLMKSHQLSGDGQNVANCGLQLTVARRQWLRALDQDPSALIAHIAGIRSHRLGIYFEGLWHFFLQQDTLVDLVVHNLPVHDQGRTIGEFDCIYYCHERERHFHLELAVKYFLSNRIVTEPGQTSCWHEWWGPECQDRLDLKITHLMDRQIQLADKTPAKALLSKLGILDVAREVEIKGYIFQSAVDELLPPYGYNSDRPLSQWIHLDQLAQYCARDQWHAFFHLPKFQWLSPVQNPSHDEQLGADDLLQTMLSHFEEQTRPQLVAALDQTGKELARFFVAGNGWPEGNGQRHD